MQAALACCCYLLRRVEIEGGVRRTGARAQSVRRRAAAPPASAAGQTRPAGGRAAFSGRTSPADRLRRRTLTSQYGFKLRLQQALLQWPGSCLAAGCNPSLVLLSQSLIQSQRLCGILVFVGTRNSSFSKAHICIVQCKVIKRFFSRYAMLQHKVIIMYLRILYD